MEAGERSEGQKSPAPAAGDFTALQQRQKSELATADKEQQGL